MMIAIQSRQFSLTDAIREHADKRIRFSLSRGSDRIRRINVRLSDINGARGGVDKRCLIEVCLMGLPNVTVEDIQSDLYVAIDRAAGRAGRAVVRRLAMGNARRRVSADQFAKMQPIDA